MRNASAFSDLTAAERFERAHESDEQRKLRRWQEVNAPVFELISPGLLRILEHIEHEHPWRVRRIRLLLRWAHKTAKKKGLVSA